MNDGKGSEDVPFDGELSEKELQKQAKAEEKARLKEAKAEEKAREKEAKAEEKARKKEAKTGGNSEYDYPDQDFDAPGKGKKKRMPRDKEIKKTKVWRNQQQIDPREHIYVAIQRIFNPDSYKNVDYESAFSNNEDYEKMMKFVLENERYDCLKAMTIDLDPNEYTHRMKTFKDLVGNEIMRLVKKGRFDMLTEDQLMSDNVCNLINETVMEDILKDYLNQRAKTVGEVSAECKTIRSAITQEKYAYGIDKVELERSEAIVAGEFGASMDFETLNEVYNADVRGNAKLSESDEVFNGYREKIIPMLENESDIDRRIEILRTIEDYDNRKYEDITTFLRTGISGSTSQGYAESHSAEELNVGYDRLASAGLDDLRKDTMKDYYTAADAVLGSCTDMAGLNANYLGFKEPVENTTSTYVNCGLSLLNRDETLESMRSDYKLFLSRENPDVFDKLTDEQKARISRVYAEREVRFLVEEDNYPMPNLRYIDMTDEDTMVINLAQSLYQIISEVKPNSAKSWLEFFRQLKDIRDVEDVRRIESALCYSLSNYHLKNNELEIGFEYLSSVEFEDVRALKVVVGLKNAWNAHEKGDDARALEIATSTMAEKTMECGGMAFKWYIKSLTEKSDEIIAIEGSMLENLSELSPNLVAETLKYMTMAAYRNNVERKFKKWVDLNKKIEELDLTDTEFEVYYACMSGIRSLEIESYANARSSFEAVSGRGTVFTDLVQMGMSFSKWRCNGGNSGDIKELCQSKMNSTDAQVRVIANWMIATINEFDGNYGYAVASYKNMLPDVPSAKVLRIQSRLAEIAILLNNNDAFDEALDYLSEKSPEMAELYRCSMLLLSGKKNATMARDRAKAVTSDDPMVNVRVKDLCGQASMVRGNFLDAVTSFEEGIAIFSEENSDADLFYQDRVLLSRMKLNLGRAMFASGEVTSAKVMKVLEDALSIISRDQSSEAKQIIGEIEALENDVGSGNAPMSRTVSSAGGSMSSVAYFVADSRNLMIGDLIGKGGRYAVYQARDGADNKEYAFKVFKTIDPKDAQTKTNKMTNKMISDFEKEKEIWMELTDEHPDKVINYIASGTSPYPWFLCERAEATYEEREPGLSRGEKMEAMYAMLRALDAIHGLGYVHNDIKPANIMYVVDHWELNDFDAAFEADYPPKDYVDGTFRYMAPEYFQQQTITVKSDVWAAAVVVYQAITRGAWPFNGTSDEEYKQNVINGKFNKGAIDSKYLPIFEKTFRVNPEERPTAAELLEFLKEV